jgi:prepilin-type N-terminal cleavage/methylation domain-containing protein/prepilin-type processing-associated H-X9-DG protein
MSAHAARQRGLRRDFCANRAGFTLVEILVVIVIMGILMTFLLPSISLGRTKIKISRSITNLRSIGTYVWDYHLHNDGLGTRRTNGGYWGSPPDGDLYKHYWGARYGIEKDLFNSPLTWTTLEDNTDGPRSEGHVYVDYGFNGVASWWHDEVANFEDSGSRRARDLDTYLHPSLTIWAQDHSEPMIDGNGDVPCYAFANDQNAFNREHPDFNPDAPHRANSEVALQEIFRNLGMCCVLWADGHVSKLGIDHKWEPSWYTGGWQPAQDAWEARENGRFTQPPPYNYFSAHHGRL